MSQLVKNHSRERYSEYSSGSSPEAASSSPITDANSGFTFETFVSDEGYRTKFLQLEDENKQLQKKNQKLEYRINILLRTLQRKETALKEAEANIYKEADDSSDNLDNFRIKLQEITTTLPSSMRGKPPSGARPIKPNKSSFRNEKFPKQGKFKALRFKADMDLIEEEEDVVEIPKEVIKGNTKSNDIEMTILKPKPQGNTQANDKIIKKAPTPVKTDRSTKIIDLQAIAGTSPPVKDAGETSLEATSNETLSQEPRAITTKGEHSSGFKKWIKSIFHVKNTELMG